MITETEKQEFISNIADHIFQHSTSDEIWSMSLGLLLRHTKDGKLYKYRTCQDYAFSSIKDGTLHCSEPSLFNDPFDCRFGIDFFKSIINALAPQSEPIFQYFEHFNMVLNDEITLESLSEQEQIVLKQWFSNQQLISMIDKIKKDGINESEINSSVKDLLQILIPTSDLDIGNIENLSSDMVSVIFDNLSYDFYETVSEDNISFSDIANGLGVGADADDISLIGDITAAYFPNQNDQFEEFKYNIDEARRALSDTIDKTFLVGCLCTDNKNRLMWSHYADCHKGFCIEYDFSSYYKKPNDILLLPVVYSNERTLLPLEAKITNPKSSDELSQKLKLGIIKVLVTKDAVWSYEDEWRIILPLEKDKHNVKMPPISCIYIGALCSEDNKSKLINIANSQNIPVKQMTIDSGKYELHVESI